MREIADVLMRYEGSGQLLLLYAASLVYLLFCEKDRVRRTLLVYLPLLWIAAFALPPVYRLYSKLDEAGTYYRLLWLIPGGLTIAWGMIRLFQNRIRIGILVACGLIILCGQYTYSNENMLPAENRLHLPQMVIDVSDTIMNETGGEQTCVAMPVGLVQFVRQYNTKIIMPYGREMQMGSYYNSVYEAMEDTEPLDAGKLLRALDEYDCGYLVMETAKVLPIDQKLQQAGLRIVADVDGYRIYYCPYEDEIQRLYDQYRNS